MDLLDELDSINPSLRPTLRPTQIPTGRPAARPPPALPPPMPEQAAPSSDLFPADPEPMRPPPSSTVQTLLSRQRPVLGASPSTAARPQEHSPATEDECLPFPIPPDNFCPDRFFANLDALRATLAVDVQARTPLASIPALDRAAKVPLVIGMVLSAEQPAGRDYLVRLADDSGQALLTLHEQAIRETRKRLHYGMLVVLADVSIFRPGPKAECLIATARNVHKLINNAFKV